MKKFFTVIVLLILVFSVSAEPLTGFWGIRFGSSVRETKTALASKGIIGASRRGDGNGDTLLAENVSFAGRITDIALYFFNDMFYMSCVYIPTSKYQLINEYLSVKNDLINKYGSPLFDVEHYRYPYKKGDGYEALAVQVGAAEIFTTWNFDMNNRVIATLRYDNITDTYQVLLFYINETIREQRNNDKNVLDDL